MARLPYADVAALPERERNAVAKLPPLNIFRMLAHAPTTMIPWLAWGNTVLTKMELPADLREIAILAVAKATGSRYEWTQHVVIGKACGMTDAQIAALDAERDDDPALDGPARTLVKAAREAARGIKVTDATLAELRAQLGERQTVEAILAIGFYVSVAIFLETTGVDLDQVDVEGWQKMQGGKLADSL